MKDIVVRLSDGYAITLRRAESKDLPSIVDLLADDPLGSTREGADTGYGPYERAFEEISADSRQLLVVAVDEHAIVGTLQLTVIPGLSRRGARRAQIEGVRVSRRYRSRGLGAAMIQWAIRESAAPPVRPRSVDLRQIPGRRPPLLRAVGLRRHPRGLQAEPLNGQARSSGRR
jgi:ribosomal protein S18 acetylase RimI-like enzyme